MFSLKLWSWLPFLLPYTMITIFSIVLVMVYFPRYIIRMGQRYYRWMNKLVVRSVNISPSLTISYMERGSMAKCKETLLLVHGFSSSKDQWSESLRHLPDSIHVVAVDMPGHGGSTRRRGINCRIHTFADALKKFVNAIGLNRRKFHLLGGSMGGQIAGFYASAHSADLKSAILVCPAGIRTRAKSVLEIEYELNNRILLLPQTLDGLYEMYDRLVHKKVHLPRLVARGIMQLRLEANWFYQQVIEDNIDEETRYRLTDEIHNITCPTMLIWGRHDEILDIEGLEVIKGKLPTPPKCIKVFEECGHCLYIERPRKFMLTLQSFIQSFDDESNVNALDIDSVD